MQYSRQSPTQSGYYWVRGVLAGRNIDCIIIVDKVVDGCRTSIPIPGHHTAYRDVRHYATIDWAGPIPRPEEKS